MFQQTTRLPGIEATVTAHRDDVQSLLLVALQADPAQEDRPRPPLEVALVIDRSGSMAGEKLEITKAAVAEFIRSLDPQDRIAVIAYDDRVDLVSGPTSPSEDLARRVERIESRGSTNLYGGWVMGAKLVGRGGRVILLSDGLANAGRMTDAHSLAEHARMSYVKFGVTTSTIGVGRDYDEGLMSGMAREGGGAHYFADVASAIRDAFSQERFSTEAIALAGVSLRCGAVTEQVGHFWGGECKKRVFDVRDLAGLSLTIRFTVTATSEVQTHNIDLPADFGYSEDARLERLLQSASEAEYRMLSVRDPRSAGKMKDELRTLILALMAHPSSDDKAVAATIDRLKASMARLEALERNYDESEAMMHRKRSMQSSYNLRERRKAFSSDAADSAFVMEMYTASAPSEPMILIQPSPEAMALAPMERWIEWQALPIELRGHMLTVALENPKMGFVIKQIERETGMRVRAVPANIPGDKIQELLRTGSARV